MIKEWVTVVSWGNGEALLRCDAKTSCTGCAAYSGCGVRVLNKLAPEPRHLFSVPSMEPLILGQRIELGITETGLLSSALLVYMSPLVGLFLCAGVCQWVFDTDLSAVCGALIGGMGGFIFSRILSRKLRHHKGWQPVILNVALSLGPLPSDTSSAFVEHK